jgi:hypothetical protein
VAQKLTGPPIRASWFLDVARHPADLFNLTLECKTRGISVGCDLGRRGLFKEKEEKGAHFNLIPCYK